jgi:hypothetical protein
MCEESGAELCTKAELDGCKNVGCGYDKMALWAKTDDSNKCEIKEENLVLADRDAASLAAAKKDDDSDNGVLYGVIAALGALSALLCVGMVVLHKKNQQLSGSADGSYTAAPAEAARPKAVPAKGDITQDV